MSDKLLDKLFPGKEISYSGNQLFLQNFIRIILPSMLLIVVMMVIIYGAMVLLVESINTEQKEQRRSIVDISIKGLRSFLCYFLFLHKRITIVSVRSL